MRSVLLFFLGLMFSTIFGSILTYIVATAEICSIGLSILVSFCDVICVLLWAIVFYIMVATFGKKKGDKDE